MNNKDFTPEYSLNRNTVNIFGPIDNCMAECVINKLQYLDYKFKTERVPAERRVITLQINSPGGSVSDGLAIFDTMNFVEAKIATVGLGMVASMGAFLLAAGSIGMRKATENCEVLIHQPLGGASGQASDIIIAARHIENIRSRLNGLLSKMTGQSLERIIADTERDNVMSAFEAKSYGLVDEVIPSMVCGKQNNA